MDTLNIQEKEILDLSSKWAEALVANDAEQIGSFMSDDWQMVSKHGVSSKQHFLQFVASGELTHSAMDLQELVSIKVFGDTAVLVARVTNTANYKGKVFEADEWTTDFFIRTGDGWKCTLTHITDVLKSV